MAQNRFDYINNFMDSLDIMDYWSIRLSDGALTTKEQSLLGNAGISVEELVQWAKMVY